jgi:putative FmdB family regulatory protein
MPIYEHRCEACKHEWEDLFRNYEHYPEECPKCKSKEKFTRLISWSAGKVELTGHELKQHLKSEGKKLAQEAAKNENVAANIVGESVYHQNELARSKK